MSKVSIFPTVFAVIVAVLGLGIPIPGTTTGTPWLVAYHQQTMPDGQTYNVDTLGFFLWGQQYTVVGKEMIQSHFIRYDQRDFPFYSLILMFIGIIAGIVALTADRTYKMNLPDRDLVWINKVNPVYPLLASTIMTGIATLYLFLASSVVVIPSLVSSNYITSFSYGIQFMTMSAIGFAVSLLLTFMNSTQKA